MNWLSDLRRHFASAWWLARSQKLRFLLTVSGVVVGVASLVTIASLLDTAEDVLSSASSQAKGDDLVVVENDWQQLRDNPAVRSLDRDDADDLATSSMLGGPEITALGSLQDLQATREGRDFTVKGMAAPASVWTTYQLPLSAGRVFTASDDTEARDVVVVGAEVDEGKLRVGDEFRVSGKTVKVVGVLEQKPQMGPGLKRSLERDRGLLTWRGPPRRRADRRSVTCTRGSGEASSSVSVLRRPVPPRSPCR